MPEESGRGRLCTPTCGLCAAGVSLAHVGLTGLCGSPRGPQSTHRPQGLAYPNLSPREHLRALALRRGLWQSRGHSKVKEAPGGGGCPTRLRTDPHSLWGPERPFLPKDSKPGAQVTCDPGAAANDPAPTGLSHQGPWAARACPAPWSFLVTTSATGSSPGIRRTDSSGAPSPPAQGTDNMLSS